MIKKEEFFRQNLFIFKSLRHNRYNTANKRQRSEGTHKKEKKNQRQNDNIGIVIALGVAFYAND